MARLKTSPRWCTRPCRSKMSFAHSSTVQLRDGLRVWLDSFVDFDREVWSSKDLLVATSAQVTHLRRATYSKWLQYSLWQDHPRFVTIHQHLTEEVGEDTEVFALVSTVSQKLYVHDKRFSQRLFDDLAMKFSVPLVGCMCLFKNFKVFSWST